MNWKKLIKPSAVVLGCAGTAIAAPLLAPYLATVSLPFFGAVLTNAFKSDDSAGNVITQTAVGFLTEIGGSAIDKISLDSNHNFHLEKMLGTAYLDSLEIIAAQIEEGSDDNLKAQSAQIFPLLKSRIKRALKTNELSALFVLQTKEELAQTAFANKFSAENITLLVADEMKWRGMLRDEVEITLRRWFNEETAWKENKLGLTSNAQLPEPLRSSLREILPQSISHRISELVKQDDFKESWISFQRAYLQGMVRVLGNVETSQTEIKQSVEILAKKIEGFANQDELVEAIAKKFEEFLSNSALTETQLEGFLERQSNELISELRGIEERLGGKIDKSEKNVIGAITDAKIELKEEIQKAIVESAVRAAQNRLKQLPTPPRDFTGREAELTELREALRDGGITISGLLGMGGVGKTVLALKLAHELKDQYENGQIYLDLKGVSEKPLLHSEVMWHVVNSFYPQMPQPDDSSLLSLYNDCLNSNRVLLFYDNAKDAAQIEPLLPPNNCLLLVTSRLHFKISGMYDKDLDEMSEQDAKDLLIKIAPRIGEHAGVLAKQCGYLPLALRLAASALNKSRSLTPSDLLERLKDKRERAALVDASFSLSYELLTEELQRRWRMLSVFPNTFDHAAAAAVWETNVESAKKSLAELEEHSLLDWEEDTERYSLHDLARDFADLKLSKTEREGAGFNHSAYYVQILSTAHDLYQKGGEFIAEGLSLYDAEIANINAGQWWSKERIEDDRCARLCIAYADSGVYIFLLRQHPRHYIYWHKSALKSSEKLKDERSRGIQLGRLGIAYKNLGEVEKAIEYYQQALEIARQFNDRRNEGRHLGNLGVAYWKLAEVSKAIEYYEQAIEISREINDRLNEGNWLGNLGIAYRNLGEVEKAIEYYEQALEIAHQIGNRRSEGMQLGNLGIAYRNLGEVEKAIEYYEQAIEISREINDRRSEGNQLSDLGLAYKDLGETIKAIAFMEASLKILEEIESPYANPVRQWLEELRGGSG